MRLDSVDIQNFLSHKHTKLVYSGTRTQVAGLNGSGKTSAAVDAPLWSLYGQARGGTTDQLKGPWDTKMKVSTVFTVAGKTYTVTRERGSSSGLSLYCDSDGIDMTEKHVAMTQEKIYQLLGSENAFTNTVIFKQGDGLRFSVMTPSERKALIDELVGIEEYAQVESAANKAVKKAETERARLANEIDRINEDKAESLRVRVELQELSTALAQMGESVRDGEAAVALADDKFKSIQESYTQRTALERAARSAEMLKLQQEGDIDATKRTVEKVTNDLRLVENGQPCPTCGTALDPFHPHVKTQLEVLRRREDEALSQLKSKEDLLPKLRELALEKQALVDKADTSIKASYAQAEHLRASANSQLKVAAEALKNKQREYDRASGRVVELERDLDKLDEYEKLHDEQARKVKGYGLIAEAFSKRGIPRELKRGFVGEVERHANTIIQSLGSFTIRLSLEKEGKERHGVTEGTLDVWVRDVAGERKLEMFSGGEKQRLSVALRLAMATAMAKRTERSLKTMIIDEALDFLDQTGKDAVLGMIGALTGFERMVFITHDPSIAGLFPERVEFAKSGDGSSVTL